MAGKLSRTALKGIVKECLMEIMEEAFHPAVSNSQAQEMLREHQASVGQNNSKKFTSIQNDQYTSQQRRETSNHSPKGSYLDNISFGNNTGTDTRSSFENRVTDVANSMTKDPVLAGIFKDTAMTTLQEQVSAEKGNNVMPASKGDMAARAASINNPTDLFGAEAASKWAQLAFSDNIRK